MSKESTPDLEEAGRQLIEAVNRRDFEAVATLYAPDAVLGNGVRLNVTLARGRLRGSGGSVELRTGVVAIWANGLIERVTTYTDIDEAHAAAERLARERG